MAAARMSRWQRTALRLAAHVPRSRLHSAVVARADAAAMERPARRWVLAVSGGVDSVTLVLLVWAHWPAWRKRLVVAHFDHRLRGRESTADRQFCARLAASLGVTFVAERWAMAEADTSEAVARAARHDFLHRVARRHRTRWIWTGHQRNDVAETLLMRVARGSGAAGLAAPRPVQVDRQGWVRLRPLLDLTRDDLQSALQAAGGRWREDATNATDRYFRNRVREQVIPAWMAASGRDALAGAARSRALLEEDDAALEIWLDRLEVCDEGGGLRLERLRDAPVAIVRRALQRWLHGLPQAPTLSSAGFEDLMRKVRVGGTLKFSLGGGFVRSRHGRLWFED